MFINLPALAEPSWLKDVSSETIKMSFPVGDILQQSLYYPAAGLDGDPIAALAGNFLSFVYVDYGVGQDDFLNALRSPGFRGYEILAQRSISQQELVPHGWTPKPPTPEDGDPLRYSSWIQKPFCEWVIFERSQGYRDDHGPRRLSLLYLAADGVASFQALYLGNGQCPGGVAVIQPGHGLGMNWTNFENQNGPFGRAVLTNPAGKPDVLLFGGAGPRRFYRDTCWPEFSQSRGFLGIQHRNIGVWRRGAGLASIGRN